ncbi:uncharacterized protein LOC135704054 [Ochlerotatus camptorhynchus]|uniref:uncharacterized protein LOC135704054 n=1 Tax=Ochlerotatus camptorhynchus TaxID=644619 RepID=UPI0031D94D8A
MDILHPHILSKQQLLDIFRQRHIMIPRLEESTRDELINLYMKYLLPQPRRGSSSSTTEQNSSHLQQDVEMTDDSPKSVTSRKSGSNVRNRIVYSESPVDNVSHGMKRIKLISSISSSSIGSANASSPTPVIIKRALEISPSKSNCSGSTMSSAPSKRQKITWP